jgi:hypothetical protein
VQDVAGVVVQPGDDLGVVAGCAARVGQAVVGEVGLPGLVGLVGLRPSLGMTPDRVESFMAASAALLRTATA